MDHVGISGDEFIQWDYFLFLTLMDDNPDLKALIKYPGSTGNGSALTLTPEVFVGTPHDETEWLSDSDFDEDYRATIPFAIGKSHYFPALYTGNHKGYVQVYDKYDIVYVTTSGLSGFVTVHNRTCHSGFLQHICLGLQALGCPV